jgi:hypothetical protein
MSFQRSNYDIMMQEKFNPIREGYNTQPFPGDRTMSDRNLQQKFCGRCPPSTMPLYTSRTEGYEPLSGFRTQYDISMQNKFCPGCDLDLRKKTNSPEGVL